MLKQAEISIGYTVRDPRPSQLKMLERAVKDAKEKATIMAKACDCKLGLVKEIDYSVQGAAPLFSGAYDSWCR